MKNRTLCRWAGILALAAAPLVAQAALVTANFSGSISGMWLNSQPFADYPDGTPVAFSVTFNETFSDGTYTAGDNLGPGTGTMTVGSGQYVLDSATALGLSFGFYGELSDVTVKFGGSGPGADGGYFYGLFLGIKPDLSLSEDPIIGFGFVSSSGFTAFRYAKASGSFAIVPAVPVPAPATLPLALASLGLVALAGLTRRRLR